MGTTWLFNVLKELVAAGGIEAAIVADGAPAPDPKWRGALIIKSHRADPVGLVTTFDSQLSLSACVMVRDAIPTFHSLIRTQVVERRELLDWLEADLSSYEALLPHMSHVAVIPEGWIRDQAVDVITQLSEFLGLDIAAERIGEIAHSFSRENVRELVQQMDSDSRWSGDFRNFDKESQWHAGHIGPDENCELELSKVEEARLGAIQVRVDQLVEDFSLRATTRAPKLPASGSSAMDYLRARRESEFVGESFVDWLARGFRYVRPGR